VKAQHDYARTGYDYGRVAIHLHQSRHVHTGQSRLEHWYRHRTSIENLFRDSKHGAALRHPPSGYHSGRNAPLPAHIHQIRAGLALRGVTTSVPRVLLSIPLTGPAPSGSPGTSRLCQGCSHSPRHLPDQAALSCYPAAATTQRRRSPAATQTTAPHASRRTAYERFSTPSRSSSTDACPPAESRPNKIQLHRYLDRPERSAECAPVTTRLGIGPGPLLRESVAVVAPGLSRPLVAAAPLADDVLGCLASVAER
jgi:hypothetical protein